MTDTPNAPADLGVAAPAAPVQEMSFEEATSRKAELMANPEWRDKYYNGDVVARQEMDAIIRGLTPKQNVTDPASIEDLIDNLRSRADIPESVADQIRTQMPVTPAERQFAEQMKAKFFRDKAWVQRYLDGGREEATKMAMINIILSLPVRDPPQP